MQLLPCHRPAGLLESAPPTSLRANSAEETWEGFWSLADEAYYTRCGRADGSEQWYRMVDELPRDEEFSGRVTMRARFPRPNDSSRMVLAAAGTRQMLVGVSRRASGARPRAGGTR